MCNCINFDLEDLKMSEAKNSTYSSSDVQALNDLEAIRVRPGMYISSVANPRQLLLESYDNSVDECQAGYCDEIVVNVDTKENKYSVRDKGRGIPIGMSEFKDIVGNVHKIETLQLLYTKSHSGGKFSEGAYKVSRGLHGIGNKCINALSIHAKAVTHRDGKAVELLMSKGEVISLEYKDTDEPNGVYVEFIPDEDIFESKAIPKSEIMEIIGISKAFGIPVKLYIDEELTELPYNDRYDLLPKLPEDAKEQHKFDLEVGDGTGEKMMLVISYTSTINHASYRGYTNMIYNSGGGSHIRFFEDCYKEAWKKYNDGTFKDTDVFIGMRGVVACFISNEAMQFSSQTKEKLTTNKAYFNKFKPMVVAKFQEYFDSNPELVEALTLKYRAYRESQDKLMSSKEIANLIVVNSEESATTNTVRRRSVVSKLKECTSKSRTGTTLYITEGDSAVGSVLAARDRRVDAALPLKGKIANVSYRSIVNALASEDVRNLANSVGAGVGEDCDASRSRYENIVLVCFTGDTKVKMLDGTYKTFEELSEMEKANPGRDYWVYSLDKNHNVVPGRATKPEVKKYVTELMEVTLDDGSKVTCTPDHKFMLRDGSMVEIKDIPEGASLMPLYHKIGTDEGGGRFKGYEMVFNPSTGTWERTHKLVKSESGLITHHKDRNKLNNEPNNLQIMTRRKHLNEHREEQSKLLKSLNDRGMYAKLGNMLINKGYTLTEDLLNDDNMRKSLAKELKTRFLPKVSSVLKWYTTFEEFVEASKHYNHKLLSKRIIKLEKAVPVYCLTVKDYGNFAVCCHNKLTNREESVFVSNCDADPD